MRYDALLGGTAAASRALAAQRRSRPSVSTQLKRSAPQLSGCGALVLRARQADREFEDLMKSHEIQLSNNASGTASGNRELLERPHHSSRVMSVTPPPRFGGIGGSITKVTSSQADFR